MAAFHVRRDKASYGQYAVMLLSKVLIKFSNITYNFRIVTVCFCLSAGLRSRILAKPLDREIKWRAKCGIGILAIEQAGRS